MHSTNLRSRVRALVLAASWSAALLWLPSCGGDSTEPRMTIDLTPFKELARGSPCAGLRTRLFLIDAKLVFWDRGAACADAAFSRTLFASTVHDTLCDFHDSIAGPIRACLDDRYRGMFDTILAHAAEADLGLGPDHPVQPIPF